MKIAMVVSTFPPDIGGMGQVVYEETARLRDHKHEVEIFALKYKRSYGEDKSVNRLKGWPRFGDAGFVPGLIWKLRRFDVIHFHYPFYGAGLVTLIAHWLFRVPLVITYHMDARPLGLKRLIQRVADYFITSFLFKAARKIMVPDADFALSSRYEKIISEKLVELPNGVDAEIFSPGEPEWSMLKLPEGWDTKKIVLFVGNILPLKRLDVLIGALAASSDPDEVLVVVGGGYDEKIMRSKVKESNLSRRISFVGRVVDQKELARYYRAARVVVIPSDVESFSLVALEAMASAKAVIASAIPGLRRRITEGETGFLFTPGSVDSLRKQLDAFFTLSSNQQTGFGNHGRERVLRENTWSQHVMTLEKSYGV